MAKFYHEGHMEVSKRYDPLWSLLPLQMGIVLAAQRELFLQQAFG